VYRMSLFFSLVWNLEDKPPSKPLSTDPNYVSLPKITPTFTPEEAEIDYRSFLFSPQLPSLSVCQYAPPPLSNETIVGDDFFSFSSLGDLP